MDFFYCHPFSQCSRCNHLSWRQSSGKNWHRHSCTRGLLWESRWEFCVLIMCFLIFHSHPHTYSSSLRVVMETPYRCRRWCDWLWLPWQRRRRAIQLGETRVQSPKRRQNCTTYSGENIHTTCCGNGFSWQHWERDGRLWIYREIVHHMTLN